MMDRLSQQLTFLLELDRLKSVYRRSYLLDESRKENSAEHSWHAALAAIVLAEHAAEPVDVARVVAMLLLHDLVEIDAGDTYAYDPVAAATQPEREQLAAERIYGLLPGDQAPTLAALRDEFDARQTPEARFAHSVDRLLPLLHNYHTDGRAWREHGVHVGQIQQRMAPLADTAPVLAEHVATLITEAVRQGWVKPDPA